MHFVEKEVGIHLLGNMKQMGEEIKEKRKEQREKGKREKERRKGTDGHSWKDQLRIVVKL